ncbi:MAG: hypothetical protein UU21_C0003G0002 [Candidatus Levybacteria bacterium GW2011_GWA2_40_8]|nr:MAG: hypothetical protein UU21_C0003G0002 [Candidatus Levybacteria bacterium GW2011_GWA2_40_8]
MDIVQEVEEVKKELLDLILKHLKENKIEAEKAQELARDFLSVLPIKDQLDLLNKLKNLGEKYPEAEKVYLDELQKASDEKRDLALSQMSQLIKQGNIEGAIATAKVLTENQEQI